jgi:DNA-binding MurR/RpiR family transcriptional regulator
MIVEQLREKAGFSHIEQSIADHFLAAGEALREQSARSIAAQLYTAASTVSRLCKRLGYSGYNEFRDAYLDELRYLSSAFTEIDANQPFRRSDDARTIAAKMGALYRETVDDTLTLVESDALQRAVDLIAQAPVSYVFSEGTQVYLAEDFADKMARIGRRVTVLHKADVTYFLGGDAKGREVFVILSYSGETPNILRVARQIKAGGGSVIAITSYGRNSLSQLADVTLHVSTRENLVEKIGAYAMNVSTLLLLDTLYSCVFELNYDDNAARFLQGSSDMGRYRSEDQD